jgi:hypothetical protein
MNNRTEKESLLAEVLAEASPAEFRAALLAETLRRARRRRQFLQARQAVGVLAVVSLLAVLVAQQFSRTPAVSTPLAKKITKPSCELVRTQPMSAGALVRTRKFSETQFAAPGSTVVEVATVSGGFRVINDNELLALLADKPVILIRTGPNSEELVFANPEDQKKLLANY